MPGQEILCQQCGITLRPFMKVCPRCGAVRDDAAELPLAAVAILPPPPESASQFEETDRTDGGWRSSPPARSLSTTGQSPESIYLSPQDTERRFPRFNSAQITLIVIGILLLVMAGLIAWLLWRQQASERQQFSLPAAVAPPASRPAVAGQPAESQPPMLPTTLNEDQRLEEAVSATLKAYNPLGFARYRFAVANGVVTIEGQADHQPEKDGARNVLRLVSGIREVVNRLTVKSEPGVPPIRVNDAEARVLEAALRRHLAMQDANQQVDGPTPAPAVTPAVTPAVIEAQREAERLRRELAAVRQRADELARRQAMEERLRREAEENARRQEDLRREEAARRQSAPVTRDLPALRSGTIAWSGMIDGTDEIVFSGSNATVRHLDGNYPREIRVSFSAPIPLVSARVSLISTLARGEIRVVQSPTPENGYSTVVRLDDSRKGGEKRYEFTLRWELDSTK
ncbi:MAG: BON domain-containing protein [Blastocatellia bacterium]